LESPEAPRCAYVLHICERLNLFNRLGAIFCNFREAIQFGGPTLRPLTAPAALPRLGAFQWVTDDSKEKSFSLRSQRPRDINPRAPDEPRPPSRRMGSSI
jgi:hypothetical protein